MLTVPVGDYSADTFRTVLEHVLNEGAFEGTIPEGSGSQYIVEGSGSAVRIRLADSSRYATDRFEILSDEVLQQQVTKLKFPGQFDTGDLRSINALVGLLTGTQTGTNGTLNFSGQYTSPSTRSTATHLAGEWAYDTFPLRIRAASRENEYETTSSNVHVRDFTVGASGFLRGVCASIVSLG